MAKSIKAFIAVLLMAGALWLGACGQGKEPGEPSAGESQPLGQEQPEDKNAFFRAEWEKYIQQIEDELPKLEVPEAEVPENVILMGVRRGDYENISGPIKAFNLAQSEYKVEVKTYETTDAIFLDLVRGHGCDLLVMDSLYLTILSDKGGLEDLSPYLDKSEKVNRENLFDAVLETGTAGGRLVGLMPGFTVRAILVEKGYTKDGGWTIEEYLALMDKNPDVPLFRCSDPQKTVGELLGTLFELTESFVDWDERSCRFDSGDFVRALELTKGYSERFRKTDFGLTPDIYEILHGGQVQTETVEIRLSNGVSDYLDLRDAFLGVYDLAGYPNPEGEASYPLNGLAKALYAMNASSAKKEAAWAFLEFMLSDYQMSLADKGSDFPVRRDILEGMLQEEAEAELTEKYLVVNQYSKEMRPKKGTFTEEDKERLLYILDHASPPTVLMYGGFRAILDEELGAFFAGDKTAEETARIIQNRVTTYLTE